MANKYFPYEIDVDGKQQKPDSRGLPRDPNLGRSLFPDLLDNPLLEQSTDTLNNSLNDAIDDYLGLSKYKYSGSPRTIPINRISSRLPVVNVASNDYNTAKMKITVTDVVITQNTDQNESQKPKVKKSQISGVSRSQKPVLVGIIPMPQDIQDEYSRNWTGDSTASIGTEIYKAVTASGGDLGESSLKERLTKSIDSIKDRSGEVITSGGVKTVLGEAAGNYRNFSRKAITNDSKEVLFNGHDFRTFNFSVDLVPNNEKDVIEILRLIRAFKTHSSPSLSQENLAVVHYPSLFHIDFLDRNDKKLDFGLKFHKDGLALTSFKTNYTPDGMWQSFKNGIPIHFKIDMTFMETALLYKQTIINQEAY